MEIKARRTGGRVAQVVAIGPHEIVTDMPREQGGDDAGPEPHDLLAAALASCTAMTVTMYAQRKGMDLQDIEVGIEQRRENDAYLLHRRIRYTGNLAAEERQRLTDIANRCPVHRLLTGKIEIVTEAD